MSFELAFPGLKAELDAGVGMTGSGIDGDGVLAEESVVARVVVDFECLATKGGYLLAYG